MTYADYSEEFRKKASAYTMQNITFTKKEYRTLFDRVRASEKEMKEELLNCKRLVFVHKSERTKEGKRCGISAISSTQTREEDAI